MSEITSTSDTLARDLSKSSCNQKPITMKQKSLITSTSDTLARNLSKPPCNLKTTTMKQKSLPTIAQSLPSKTKTQQMEPSARPWRIENYQLQITPYTYNLEKTHVVIADLSAPVICGRVCEFARVHSLDAKWAEGEPNRIHCSTPEQVEVVIKLWRSEEVIGGIIVEAKRWKGDGFDAHRLKYLLFKSLQLKKHKFQEARSITDRSIDDYITKESNNHNEASKPSVVDLSRLSDAAQTIETATRLMCSRSTEDTFSGLKLMDFLTDPRRVIPGISLYASNLIWRGIDPRRKTRLRATDILRNYVLDNSNADAHFWAVRTVGNAFLHMHSRREDLCHTDMEKWSRIIPMLLDDMENVKSNPHTACYAIRCLRGLIEAKLTFNENNEKRKVFSDEEKRRLRVNISKVVAYGKEANADIEKEGIKLFSTILK